MNLGLLAVGALVLCCCHGNIRRLAKAGIRLVKSLLNRVTDAVEPGDADKHKLVDAVPSAV